MITFGENIKKYFHTILHSCDLYTKEDLNTLITKHQKTLQKVIEENKKLRNIIEDYKNSKKDISVLLPKLKFVESVPQPKQEDYQLEFSISDDEIKEFISTKKLGKPTDEQWKVILSKNSRQLVAAAAGSGKSTTMLLRILVLIKFGNIHPSTLIVFSFTKKSCEDLRCKLEELFKKSDLILYKSYIKAMIRTFHSKVYEIAKESGVLSTHKLFEFIKDTDEKSQIEAELEAVENTFNNTKLSHKQSDILKQIYTQAYSADIDFKKNIHEIFINSNINKSSLREENKDIDSIKFCLSFSKTLGEIFENVYDTSLDTTIKKKDFSKLIHDADFYYHLYLKKLDVYLIFHPDSNTLVNKGLDDREIEHPKSQKKHDLQHAKNIHKKAYGYCDLRVIFVENQQHLNDILLIEDISNKRSEINERPIIFNIKISSMYREKLVYEYFYTLINFIESTGISHEQLSQLMINILKDNSIDTENMHILTAMMIYWKYLIQYFNENKIYQFSNLLRYFSENNIDYFDFTSSSTQSMQHILIDEFQDISPEIISFVRGSQNYLSRQSKKTSLMCIGDDWQSIYGWRGSTPSYLINFNKHFNCTNKTLIMSYNFRSSQHILSKAEMIMKKISMKLNKKVLAYNQYTDTEFKKINFDNSNENFLNYEKIIEDIENKISKIQKEWPDAVIYILSRQQPEKFRNIKSAKSMTFHSSKGLEADVCFLIGDCNYKENDKIRNLIYRLAKYPQSYDESQRDESIRLAYVAATRAKRKAYWYGLEKSEFGHIFE